VFVEAYAQRRQSRTPEPLRTALKRRNASFLASSANPFMMRRAITVQWCDSISRWDDLNSAEEQLITGCISINHKELKEIYIQ
jgi:hypothetical protein